MWYQTLSLVKNIPSVRRSLLDEEDDNSEQHGEAAENAAHDEQSEPDFGDPHSRAVGVEGALGVLLARGGRPLEADAAVVELLHERPAGLGLLREVTLHHGGVLKGTRGRAEDLELPVLGQVAGRVGGHVFFLLLSPALGGGCGGCGGTRGAPP